jgi:nucleoside-diphosphate-sugar epimerase
MAELQPTEAWLRAKALRHPSNVSILRADFNSLVAPGRPPRVLNALFPFSNGPTSPLSAHSSPLFYTDRLERSASEAFSRSFGVKVAVTGGAGYCGIPLCAALLAQGHTVTVVDNFSFGPEPVFQFISNPNLHVVQRDVRHSDRSYLTNQDVVFHLAAISGYPECAANAHSAWQINVEATAAIADALSADQCLIFPSTTSFYGSSGTVSTEQTPPAPVSLYGSSKWQAEQRVMQRSNSTALRWPTVFGVSSRMRSGLLVNDLTAKAVREQVIVLYDPDSTRTFLHVSDLVSGYLFVLDHWRQMAGQVFNVGSADLNFTKRQVAQHIQAMQPCEIMEASVVDKDLRNFVASFEKVQALGFRTRTTLDQGIAELIKLYRFYAPQNAIRPM